MERIKIPEPPRSLLEVSGFPQFKPAKALNHFIAATILNEQSELFNQDHIHLIAADIGFLWTNWPNKRNMKRVVGEAEMPNPKGGAWQKARAERQLMDWFGGIPDFVITLSADHRAECSDIEFLALLEHELYHCGHAVDAFGMPRFRRSDGRPIFGIRGHDIEEFNGVVRRYGADAAGMDRVEFVNVVLQGPEIGPVRVRALCGNCILV